mgnify:CR=1 FL=1|tara:strand:- start:589 stop:1479 length:891 start_codon:yes stop_codon:yes gene_type:complete
MELTKLTDINQALKIIDHADKFCKDFDPSSNCAEYLINKINADGSTTYIATKDNDICALGILEIMDRMYGNLILHCIEEDDEKAFAEALKNIIEKNILELIQFRSSFNYRDTFINLGFREKERVRMIHNNIKLFEDDPVLSQVNFKKLEKSDNAICGVISFNAHKHRQHIECYDVYNSEQNRAIFANDLRSKKHGSPIETASLLMYYDKQPIGLIEVVNILHFDTNIGWIMDVAILPQFQGMGLGKHIIKKSLGEASKAGYESVGLGVTLTNKGAYQLYNELGFEEYEVFVEIIGT